MNRIKVMKMFRATFKCLLYENIIYITHAYLQPSDLKSISQSLYHQRLKEYPALPKDRMATHACLENLAVKTSKDENFLAYNDSDTGMTCMCCHPIFWKSRVFF
jgi:hypothetical protein